MCVTIGANSGSCWPQDGATWAQVRPSGLKGQPRRRWPILRTQCAISYVTSLVGVHARPCCPHWACLGPNFGARCPYTGQVAKVKPNLHPNTPALRHVGPQVTSTWAQVRPKLATGALNGPIRPKLRPNTPKFDFSLGWAGSCLAQIKAKDGQGQPSLTPAGFVWGKMMTSEQVRFWPFDPSTHPSIHPSSIHPSIRPWSNPQHRRSICLSAARWAGRRGVEIP